MKELFRRKKVAKVFVEENQLDYKFKNELGSIMTMEFANSGGLITGTYKSGVVDSNTYALTGFVSGNVVTFTVDFTEEGSIAAWAGQAVFNSVWEIHTLWHLVEPTASADMWEDTYTGSNIFTQVT
jgi:hypothetical protein